MSAAPEPPAPRPASAAPAAADALKVLVVDDTATNRQILQVFLRKLGFQVDVAVDGADAVERFVAGSPDLVLMDVMMPVVDGFEATRRIKQLCGDRWVPVVFLSALDKEENLVTGLDAGGDDYLHKPVSFVVLDAKLRSLTRSIRVQRALDESRRRTQAIADNVLDAIITIDDVDVIQSVNAAAVRIFGYNAEEIVGRNVNLLMPEPYRREHAGYVRNYLAGRGSGLMGKGRRSVEGLRKNGQTFPLEVGVSELSFDGRRLFVGILRDVTQERAAAEQLRRNAERLQRYHDVQEEENALAQKIIERQMARPGLADPAIRHWLAPAANFSGDVIAAARAPEGDRLYVLLADATGHGLAAAISVLPVLTVFYGYVEFGYPLGHLVMELNRQLRATMPSGRFVAASLLCIDDSGTAELWQGGMPDVLLLDAAGKLKQRFTAQHLPLGIVDFDAEMSRLAPIELASGDQLVMFSDGLIEAADGDGDQFGIDRLIEVLGKAPPESRLEAVRSSLYLHTGIGQSQDDVSLLLVDWY